MAQISLGKRRKRTSEDDRKLALFRKIIIGLAALAGLALLSDYSSEIGSLFSFGGGDSSGSSRNTKQRYLTRSSASPLFGATFPAVPEKVTEQAVVKFLNNHNDKTSWQNSCPCAKDTYQRGNIVNGVEEICQCPLKRFEATALEDLQMSITLIRPGQLWDLSASRSLLAVPYRPEQNYETVSVILNGHGTWSTTTWKLGMKNANVTHLPVGPNDVVYYDNYHPRQNIQTSTIEAKSETIQILSLKYMGKKKINGPLSEEEKKRNIAANLLFPDVKTNHFDMKPHPKTGKPRRVDKQHVPKRPTRTLEYLNIHSTLYSADKTKGVSETPPHTDTYDVVHVVLDGQVQRNPQGDALNAGTALVIAGNAPHGLRLPSSKESHHVVFEFHCGPECRGETEEKKEAVAASK